MHYQNGEHKSGSCFITAMGGCCSSCFGGRNNDDDDDKATLSTAELELQAQQTEKDLKSLSIARGMSAPTIEVEDRTKVNYGNDAFLAIHFIIL
jgi:hypothetical protein